MLRTSMDRPVLALLGGLLALAGLLVGALTVQATAPTAQTPTVQGMDVPLAPGAFQLQGGPTVSSTRTLLDLPAGQTAASYLSQPIKAPIDYTDLAVAWAQTLTASMPLTPTSPLLPPGAPPPTGTITASLPLTVGSTVPTTPPQLPTATVASGVTMTATTTVTTAAPLTATETVTAGTTLTVTATLTTAPVLTATATVTTGLLLHTLALAPPAQALTATATLPLAAPLTDTATVTTASPLTTTATVPAGGLVPPTPTLTAGQPLTATATITAAAPLTAPAASPTPATLLVEVRTSSDGVTWSDWRPAPPDAITDPAAPITLTYSSLLSVPQGGPAVRWAQVRLSLTTQVGAPPPQVTGVTVSFINGGTAPAVQPVGVPGVASPTAAAAPVKPALITRSNWGAPDGDSSPAWPPQYRRVQHIILSQPVGLADDTNFAARVRALWYYQARVRGWGDIGYNYLVDPHGGVYEGRAGGENVVGRHAYPFDAGSMGVGLLGPAPATPGSGLTQLLAWAAATYGLPTGRIVPFSGVLACGDTLTLDRPVIAEQGAYAGSGCGASFNAASGPDAVTAAVVSSTLQAVIAAQPIDRVLFLGSTTPLQMVAGAVVTTSVTVRNTGSLLWPADLPYPVHLGYHWANPDGTLLEGGWSDIRNPLPRDMAFGDTALLRAQVSAPITVGTYLLRWDMVHELHNWFEDAHTSQPLIISVTTTLSDTLPPTTRMVGMLPVTNHAQFAADWVADDPYSAITSYDVQYRYLPQGDWIDWQTAVTTTEAIFTAQDGYTYAFRSRATDAAGNTGAWPTQPQAIISVDLKPPQVQIITPTLGVLLRPGPVQVRGTVDPSALVTVNGLPAMVLSGTFTATVQAAEPALPLRVVATNAAGNSSEHDLTVAVGGPVSDVPETAPEYPAVLDALNRGLLSVGPDRHFQSDQPITRAQLAKILVTAFKWPLQPAAKPRFSDVGTNYWARAFIDTAASRGVLDGYNDGTFHPDDPVTRAQAAKALVLAAKWTLVAGPASPFPDMPLTDWAYPYVETAYRHGAIPTQPGSPFHPKAFVTRAEISQMVYYTLGDLAAKH